MKEKNKNPLVSICIPNYNYGHYLEECLNSIVNQTYDNIEVIFRDNNSTDQSLDIANEFEKKYRDRLYINIARHKRNIGSDLNSNSCIAATEGKYFMILGSDDALEPDFISKCVQELEQDDEISMMMTHRNEIDENGKITKQPPFFNQSFVCDGEEMASIYMMAGIAIPSQCLTRITSRNEALRLKRTSFSVCGDWYINFLLACVGRIGYINEALVNYRVHSGNETNMSEENFMGIIEHFKLLNEFRDISEIAGLKKPQTRYEEAIEKLGTMCLRYAIKMLMNNKDEVARRYVKLSEFLSQGIENNNLYQELQSILNKNQPLKSYEHNSIFKRLTSYNPPEKIIKVILS